MVGEHSYCTEAPAVRRCGAVRRENVGMSNHNPNEKLEPRKSKVSVALAINHGLGGPKAIPKGAADGQTVNIPSRPRVLRWGTKDITFRALLVWHSLREVQRAPREGWEFTQPTGAKGLPRKAQRTIRGLRTGNRHRWIGRVAQGERVIHR